MYHLWKWLRSNLAAGRFFKAHPQVSIQGVSWRKKSISSEPQALKLCAQIKWSISTLCLKIWPVSSSLSRFHTVLSTKACATFERKTKRGLMAFTFRFKFVWAIISCHLNTPLIVWVHFPAPLFTTDIHGAHTAGAVWEVHNGFMRCYFTGFMQLGPNRCDTQFSCPVSWAVLKPRSSEVRLLQFNCPPRR